MRPLKIFGAALFATLALVALAATTASAALPEALSTFPNTYTGTSGAGTLETLSGEKITCTKNTDSGEASTAGTGTLKVTFEGCKAFGLLPAKSLGGTSEVIKTSGSYTLCYTNKATKEVGIVVKLGEPVHIETTGIVELAIITGSVIGKITPVNTKTKSYKIVFKQKTGEQEPQKCEGGATTTLSTEKNENKKPETSGELTEATIAFAKELEIMA